jgi:multiple sugar transport system substrate-binding protein
MTNITRRAFIKSGTTLATSAALTGPSLLEWSKTWAQAALWKPEKDAQLSLLRWKYFLQSEDDGFVALIDAFTKATGVKVTISRESIDDVQPKASVAANTGSGPDLFWALYSPLPHLFPQKCLDVTDVAEYLGKKYDGWAPVAISYGKGAGNKWIDIPVSFVGNPINYRISSVKKAGFSRFPETTESFLECAKAMKANNTPGGFALGHATGDGNAWAYWCLWAHGANMVDANDKVIVNSIETEHALQYARQLYDQMIPGVVGWNDSSNNKAFLAGELHWTDNGISIYAASSASGDPKLRAIADDMNHAYWPIGPVGKITEFNGFTLLCAMGYTKYPQACKALMAFMMEADQFNKWLAAAQGYLSHSLNAYDNNPVWTADPKRVVFRDAAKRSLSLGGMGSIGQKAANAIADFVLLDMFANYCTGREDAKAAIRIAERQLQRIYR